MGYETNGTRRIPVGRRTNVFLLARSNRPLLNSIEPRIRALVDALNGTGLVQTFTSCEGHYGYRGPPGDFTIREQASVGFFLGRGVSEQEVVRFFGKVLAGYHFHAVRGAVFEVAKRYVAPLDGTDAPEVYFDFTIRPFDPHASNVAKRISTDRALAAIVRSVKRAMQQEPERIEESSSAEIKAALAAHGMWKTHLDAAVTAGTATVDVVNAGQDDRCTIGRWLHGTPELKAHPGFQKVVTLHARFHREASKALQLALAAKKDEARKLIDASSIYSRSSADLTRALESWAA
jgi:hypothetical protein